MSNVNKILSLIKWWWKANGWVKVGCAIPFLLVIGLFIPEPTEEEVRASELARLERSNAAREKELTRLREREEKERLAKLEQEAKYQKNCERGPYQNGDYRPAAKLVSRDAIKVRLHDRGSAKFYAYHSVKRETDGCIWSFAVEFSAENAFGARRTDTWRVILSADPNLEWRVLGVEQ